MEKIILGIDPGTTIMGYAVIKGKEKNLEVLTLGVLKLSRLDNHYDKLSKIFNRTLSLIDDHKVNELAIESPFFGKNVQSMLKLGRAQGAAIAAALSRSISVNEYAPLRIKQAITGLGSASKEQVATILMQMFAFDSHPEYLDATDALAVAICHYFQSQCLIANTTSVKKNRNSSWEDFIKNNPDRIK